MSQGLLFKLSPETMESEAVQTTRAQAELLRQWAQMLEKPGLTMDELEALSMEVKMSSAWLMVAVNQRREAARMRGLLQPAMDLWSRIAGDVEAGKEAGDE